MSFNLVGEGKKVFQCLVKLELSLTRFSVERNDDNKAIACISFSLYSRSCVDLGVVVDIS